MKVKGFLKLKALRVWGTPVIRIMQSKQGRIILQLRIWVNEESQNPIFVPGGAQVKDVYRGSQWARKVGIFCGFDFFFKFPFSPISNVINSRVLEMDQIMLVHGLICDSYSVTDAIAGFSTIKTHTFCYIVCRLFASCISDWELVSVIRVATSKRLILLPPVSQGSLFHWRKTVNVFSKIQGLAKKLQFRIHYWWWMWSP